VAWQVHGYGEAAAELVHACTALRLPLHPFAWSEQMRRAGFARDALYLVRPDVYIALADSGADRDRLRRYCRKRSVRS
jgi:hypothetical protein